MRKLIVVAMLLTAIVMLLLEMGARAQSGTIRTVCDSGCTTTLINTCLASAVAGDVCLVYQDYSANEVVQTVNAGTGPDTRIIVKAMGKVRIKAFRFLDDYVTLDGFILSGYVPMVDTPSSFDAAIRIESGADYFEVLNNRIEDGIYHYDDNYVFNAATKTITTDGNFLAARFVPGMRFYITCDVNTRESHPNHDNTTTAWGVTPALYEAKIIKTVTASTITLCDGSAGPPCNGVSNTVFDDPSMESTFYVNWGSDKNGLWSINMFLSGGTGPTGGVISGNTFEDVAGRIINIAGTNHVAERNTFIGTNGWRHFSVSGSGHRIRYNVLKDSPRWPGFPPPLSEVAEEGQGSWDMYDNILVAESQQVTTNILFDHNFISNVDHQWMRISGEAGSVKSSGFTITNNVFYRFEKPGGSNAPGTTFANNTVYKSAHAASISGTAQSPIIVAESSNHGNAGLAPGSVLKNNVFVENGYLAGGNIATQGWYSTKNHNSLLTPGVAANYNFVAGPASGGFPAKTDFQITGNGVTLETNGINGGDPRFQNSNDPLGPDGLPWTADDGLIPKANSPLCTGGEGGTFIGAYACASAETSTVKRVCAAGLPYCTYTTIQACATAATTGMTCLVDSGLYAEMVITTASGVTFRAHGLVTVDGGFDVRHPNTTVDGFDITDTTPADNVYLITLRSGGTYAGATGAVIQNNTLRDTCTVAGACSASENTGGINGAMLGGIDSDNVTIFNNTFRNLNYIFINVSGDGWTVQGNRMSVNNRQEWFRIAGDNTVVRRNVVGPANYITTSGNHPDVFQMFDEAEGSASAINTLFEENFIYSLGTFGHQLNQVNSSKSGTNGLVDDFHTLAVRRNVFVNMPSNSNNAMPFITWENNTFFQVGFTSGGLTAGGTMSRGEANNFTARNNVLLANGPTSGTVNGTSGWYLASGQTTAEEGINLYVTLEWPVVCQNSANCPNAFGIWDDMIERGYLSTNGDPTAALRAVPNEASLGLDAAFETYRAALWTHLQALVAKDDLFDATFSATYNYVAGSPGAGYIAKRADGCNCGATYTAQRFCEAAAQCVLGGINGGNPNLVGKADFVRGVLAAGQVTAVTWTAATKTLTKTGAFANITALESDDAVTISVGTTQYGVYTVASFTANTLVLGVLADGPGIATDQTVLVTPQIQARYLFGPDGIPFTLDDGMKPRIGSLLCGADSNKKAIGAYSCDAFKVLETSIGKPTGVKVVQ